MQQLLSLPDTTPEYTKLIDAYNNVKHSEYLEAHPNVISWKGIATQLYRSGEDASLNQLFKFVKSPEGEY